MSDKINFNDVKWYLKKLTSFVKENLPGKWKEIYQTESDE